MRSIALIAAIAASSLVHAQGAGGGQPQPPGGGIWYRNVYLKLSDKPLDFPK